MLLSESMWRTYHGMICSPGAPWDCELGCLLWQRWDKQSKAAEGKPTYASLTRKP